MKWSILLNEKRKREHKKDVEQRKLDPRNEFQKDYHRIVGSASFRRLQDKTQVFPLDQSDFIRTRLTHSLEVASFAKSLGQMIFLNIMQYNRDDEVTEEVIEKICSVLECAGLIHDIGNPPFGHFGEDYIREWFKENLSLLRFGDKPLTAVLNTQMTEDLYHFEGNAQALRLLSKLHFLIDENGMNLTYTLLNTIIKYPVSSLETDKTTGNIKDKKMGYFYAEREIFDDITKNTGAIGCRHPLAFILEAADDIAYKTADIEDGVKKGRISYHQLCRELNSDKYLNMCCCDDERKTYENTVKKLSALYERAVKNEISNPEQNAVQNWIIYAQGMLMRCAAFSFTRNYDSIMKGTFKDELLSASYANALSHALSDIACRYIFLSKPIIKLEIAASSIFKFLLDKLVHAAINFDSEYEMSIIDKKVMSVVSENYIKAYKVYSKDKDESEKLYLRLMLVCDFICGMTDSYAKRLYQEFSGII